MRAIWQGAISFGLVNIPVGLYPATNAHGPMVHIDARGKRARWEYGS